MAGSWFLINGIADVFNSYVGTKPGEPIAYALFVLAFESFQSQWRATCEEKNFYTKIPLREGVHFGSNVAGISQVNATGPMYMADDTVPLDAPDALSIRHKLAKVTCCYADLAKRHNFRLNFEPGKPQVWVLVGAKKIREPRK